MTIARDADVQALLQKAGASVDPEIRRNAFSEGHPSGDRARRLHPAVQARVRYVAFSKQLNFEGFSDDIPRFYLSSWKVERRCHDLVQHGDANGTTELASAV